MAEEMLPQYLRVAMNIASRIALGEYPESKKLTGRSTLSSEYSVSPETVRKALRLLADMGIVQVQEGKSTIVISREQARNYLENLQTREEQAEMKERFRQIFKEYTGMGKQLLELGTKILDAQANPLPSEQSLPNYEVKVPKDSDKIGMTIGDLRVWQCTGATIVAVKRGQSVHISPGPYYELQAGDVLVYVGDADCKAAVEHLVSSGKTENSLYQIQEKIVTSIHMKELAVIAEALDARMGDITDITAMTKGMTNRSYLFSCKGERYILRIPGEGTSNLINRSQEAAVYQAIRGKGLCDDLAYMDAKTGLKVTRFLEGIRNCDPYREEDLVQCMALLRKFHSMKLQVDHSFSVMGNIQYYESLRGGPSAYEDYEETKRKVLSLQGFIDAHSAPVCLTHIDAVPDNFLFYQRDGKEQLQLTDWEYAGMQDPNVDIAMFCIYSLYDREHVDHLIDLYYEGGCDPMTRVLIYCYISACGLLWSNWCEYKRRLEVDFGEYALWQYRYAKEYFDVVQEALKELGAGE